MPPASKALKPRHKQRIAIQERRRRVHYYLQQHKPLKDIAQIVGVTVQTVIQDKHAIAKELAAQHFEVKAIDLDDLDTMEQECIDQLEKRLKEITSAINDPEAMGNPNVSKVLKVMYDNAGTWWDKRLRLKQLKGKWLGYEEVEKQEPDIQVDNRSITINIQDPNTKSEVPFDDWVKGMFRELPESNAESTTSR